MESVEEYCLSLIDIVFHGESSTTSFDESDEDTILNLGLYLSLINKVIRKYENVTDFTIEDEEYVLLLRLVATKRKSKHESTDQCFERLLEQSKIFQEIYHERGEHSERLYTKEYWGTRQQLLCGKVIVDWLGTDKSLIDPIFGVLLCPCGGRVGPGNSCVVHNLLYDQDGHMAYHSAVHDAFGYLITFHKCGPGYDYLQQSVFDKSNPLAGQVHGISFWKKALLDNKTQKLIIKGSFEIMLSSAEYRYAKHL